MNFKSSILKTYLDASEKKLKISYINEKTTWYDWFCWIDTRKKISENFIVTNCDIFN